MAYSFPVGDIYVPCSWSCHLNRNPPSSEAGTDYASGYGTPVAAPATGTIIDLKSSNSSATGRYITIAADDGRTLRALHLSAIYVQVGWRVNQGAIIGASGASGYGSDWYYGPHLHQTLWGGCAFCAQTIDFQLYVGSTPPPKPPDPPKPPEPDVNINTFAKTLALGSKGYQTIDEGTWEYLWLDAGQSNSKLVTGPNLNCTAVISITFDSLPLPSIGADGKLVVPESVQMEPVKSVRQSDGSLKNTSLYRQEVIASPGLTRVKVPIDVALTNSNDYLRIKLFAPGGQGTIKITEAYIRGAEYTKS